MGHAHVCSNNKSYQDDVDNNFNLKDIGAIDVIQEMKISNISDGLVLSQLHERCDINLVRTPYMKSVCWILVPPICLYW